MRNTLLNRIRGVTAPIARVPGTLRVAGASMLLVVFALMGLSFAIGNVVVHQGYDQIAMAKPTKEARVIRQAEVAQFGNRVSAAFGIRDEVATEFADWIIEASERQNLAPELLASLVLTESLVIFWAFHLERRSR